MMPRASRAVVVGLVSLASLLGSLVLAQSGRPAPAKGRAADPLDEPLRLIARARKAYAKIKEYSCTMIKRERLEGELSPNHLIALKVRKEPLSVSMVWQ